jgi:hypothetical protein
MQEWGEVQMGRKVQMGVVVTAAGTWNKTRESRSKAKGRSRVSVSQERERQAVQGSGTCRCTIESMRWTSVIVNHERGLKSS